MSKTPRKLIFGEEVRSKVMAGVTTTYNAVATTLGSRGRNVSIEHNWGAPTVIHDGVTVAREVVLEDPFENQAAQLVIQAAQKTNDEAGDGTTTATILTYAITKEGIKSVSSGVNPMVIRKGIDKAVEVACDFLRLHSVKVDNYEKMKHIASISAASDDLGEKIATAVQKVGEYGVVTVTEGQGHTTEVEYKEGMEFNKGLMSPLVATNHERMEAVIEGDNRPYIVLANKKLTLKDFLDIYRKITTNNKGTDARVVVIADDFEDDLRATLIANKYRNSVPVWGVQAPDFGPHRTNILNDIAVVTGGKVIGGDSGMKVDQFVVSDDDKNTVGRASKILITRENTVIIGGDGDKEMIDARIKHIKTELKNAKSEGETDKLQGRLAKLVSGVAVIAVGASSEIEMREIKERVYDAVNATQAAVEEGVVPGGGVALVKAGKAIENAMKDDELNIGMKIVKQALSYPTRKLVSNSGHDNPGYVVGEIAEDPRLALGYNVNTEKFEDLVKSGIIDPVKVGISALRNAASIAIMLLTTECMISYQREDKKEVDGIGSFSD